MQNKNIFFFTDTKMQIKSGLYDSILTPKPAGYINVLYLLFDTLINTNGRLSKI